MLPHHYLVQHKWKQPKSDAHSCGYMLPSSAIIRLEHAQDQSFILVIPSKICAANIMHKSPDTKAARAAHEASPCSHTRQGHSSGNSRQACLPVQQSCDLGQFLAQALQHTNCRCLQASLSIKPAPTTGDWLHSCCLSATGVEPCG